MKEPVERSDELLRAARDGETALVARLLDAGLGVDAIGREGRTALDLAVQEGHAEVVRLLLAAGADAEGNAGPYHELTPMTEAAMFGRAAVAEVLIDAGVSMGAQTDRIPHVPLVLAATLGHTDVVELLLDRGADVEDRDFKGRSPLEWTASFGQVAAVRLLLDRGAEPTARALADASANAERHPERAEDYARVLDALRAAGAVDSEGR
ncbi:ankyrin repeat domain-containing protein [Streptomyces sp. NPDC059781]|uniref:ankyrin repeat domain-containing protein n=1 Tax=unclassified Streptomyces TaxID=2593676 RepID=UPI003662AC7C